MLCYSCKNPIEFQGGCGYINGEIYCSSCYWSIIDSIGEADLPKGGDNEEKGKNSKSINRQTEKEMVEKQK